MTEEMKGLAERLTQLLAEGPADAIQLLLARYQAADIADAVERMSDEEAHALFELMLPETAGPVLDELGDRSRATVLEALSHERTSTIIDDMPSDEAADALGDMDAEDAQRVIELMTPREARQARELLQHDEESAGGLMATEFVTVEQHMTASQVIQRLRELAEDVESVYDIYVVDRARHIVGAMTLRDLIVAPPTSRARDIMHREVICVSANLDQEEVARLVSRHDLLTIPVVDDERRLIGMVTVDDIMEVMEEETSEDVYWLSGAADAPHRAEARPLGEIVTSRISSLVLLLATGGGGAWLVWRCAGVFGIPLAAAALVPMFVLLGGNVGGQAAGTMLAAFADEDRSRGADRALTREAMATALTSLGCAALAYAIIHAASRSPVTATAAGSVMIAVFLAGMLGALVPWVARRWGADPAATVNPLVTSVCDLASVTVYVLLVAALTQRQLSG